LPAVSVATTVRLWLSYQPYGLVLVGVPGTCLALTMMRGPWWLAGLVALAGIVRYGTSLFASACSTRSERPSTSITASLASAGVT
jgi:hypothetical protein